jgi:hypothetical protein
MFERPCLVQASKSSIGEQSLAREVISRQMQDLLRREVNALKGSQV